MIYLLGKFVDSMEPIHDIHLFIVEICGFHGILESMKAHLLKISSHEFPLSAHKNAFHKHDI